MCVRIDDEKVILEISLVELLVEPVILSFQLFVVFHSDDILFTVFRNELLSIKWGLTTKVKLLKGRDILVV